MAVCTDAKEDVKLVSLVQRASGERGRSHYEAPLTSASNLSTRVDTGSARDIHGLESATATPSDIAALHPVVYMLTV